MKKLFLDTNFICDFFIREEYFELTQSFLRKALSLEYKCCISYLTIANFAYIIRREPILEIYTKINSLINNFDVLSNTKEQIARAIKLDSKDFEDSLQYETAKENDCDFIITRNKKDFIFSDIPVYSPRKFLESYLS